MKIYCETWATRNDRRLDIAFTYYEMKEMPYVYRQEKRQDLFEQHRFDYKSASKIKEWFFDADN